MDQERVTTATFKKYRDQGKKITMLTAYDYPMAQMVDAAGIDSILVGDSLGNVVLGYPSSIPVTMDDMVHHTQAVVRGVRRALVVADMPFLSYHVSRAESLQNAGRLIQVGGAQAVKLEGGVEVAETVRSITDAGIPVVGHIGLTPQSVNQLGGFKVQGKDVATARQLLADAKSLEQAGAFAVVLECVPTPLAKKITEAIGIATIGIGAGPYCSGQVLVAHDMLGFAGRYSPKFAKKYAQVQQVIMDGLSGYAEEVTSGAFPAAEHGFDMDESVLEQLDE